MKRLAAALILGTALFPSAAFAEVTVTILGLRSAAADEQMAQDVTEALRRAASTAPHGGITISNRQNQLSQLLVVFDCEDPTPSCMQEIGRSLNSQRLIYGLVEPESGRANSGYALTLRYFNVDSGQVERDLREVIPRNIGDQALADQAGRFLNALAGTARRGELALRSNVEGARVRVGTRDVGTTTRQPLVIRDLEPGEVALEVSREGYEPFRQTVSIEAGQTREVSAELSPLEAQPGGEPTVGGGDVTPPGGDEPLPTPTPTRRRNLSWIGYTLIGVAAGFGGLGLWSSLEVNQTRNDADLRAHFRQGDNICDTSPLEATGPYDVETAQEMCDDAELFEVLQFVFYGLAAASLGFGIWVAVRETRRSREPDAEALRLTIEPVALREGGAVTATLTF